VGGGGAEGEAEAEAVAATNHSKQLLGMLFHI